MENKITTLKSKLCDLLIIYFENHCGKENREQKTMKEEIIFLSETIKILEN